MSSRPQAFKLSTFGAFSVWKWSIGAVALALTACGGGGESVAPLIVDAQVSMSYGKTATITLVGKYFSSAMTAETGSCTNPTFAATSTPERAVINCKVSAIGNVPVVVKDASGKTIYSTNATVPKPQVTMITSKGNIVMELEPEKAPITVNNFLGYVSSGYYQSTLFHRVISNFVVQGGGYTTGMVKKAGQLAAISLETNKGLSNVAGSVAMARTSVADSATSEFFINLVDNTSLDYKSESEPGYAVFGTVISGMEVAKAIGIVQTGTSGTFLNVPTEDVSISFAIQTK